MGWTSLPARGPRPRTSFRPGVEGLEGRALLSSVPDAIELSFARGAKPGGPIVVDPTRSIPGPNNSKNFFRVDVRVDSIRGRIANNVELIKVNLYWATGPDRDDIIDPRKYQETATRTIQINHAQTKSGDVVSLYFNRLNTPGSRWQQPPGATYLVGVIDPDNYLIGQEKNRANNTTGVRITPAAPPGVRMTVEAINQDDPSRTAFQAVAGSMPVVYGGSEASTADNLRLRVAASGLPAAVKSVNWSVSGPGASSYAPPAASSRAMVWDVGDIRATAGVLTFTATLHLTNGRTMTASHKVEVGIRTDDVIVVGWIDAAGVTLSTAGVARDLTRILPPNGKVAGSGTLNQLLAVQLFGALSENATNPRDLGLSRPLTAADRKYILNWAFKYAANPDPRRTIPGGDFRDAAGKLTSTKEINDFLAHPTNYKLFNRFQVKYRLDPSGDFLVPPTVLHHRVAIGSTIDPLTLSPKPLPGQAGPFNGRILRGAAGIGQVNDGSPEAPAIRLFNTLMGKGVSRPVFWENIGSQIRFTTRGTAPVIFLQPYPTYSIFRNGRLVSVDPEAREPGENFYPKPYPFSNQPSAGLFGVTPGGRRGDASSLPSPGARIPAFIVAPSATEPARGRRRRV